MHREDDSKYLLYIEPDPKLKSIEPVEDELTEAIDQAMRRAISGTGWYSQLEPHDELEHFSEGNGYRGVHVTACGVGAGNKDYLIDGRFITNSLAPYYVRYYRESICEYDMDKLKSLL